MKILPRMTLKKVKKMDKTLVKNAILAYAIYTVAASPADNYLVNGLQYGLGYWFASWAIDYALSDEK